MKNLVLKINECGVKFQTWANKAGELEWSSLTGNDYKRLFQQLPDKLFFVINNDTHDEVCNEKTNSLVSDLVQHKLGCTASEDGYRLEISELESRGIVLSMNENKGADQGRGYREADLRLCFRTRQTLFFFMTRLYSYFKMFICCDMLSLSLYSLI